MHTLLGHATAASAGPVLNKPARAPIRGDAESKTLQVLVGGNDGPASRRKRIHVPLGQSRDHFKNIRHQNGNPKTSPVFEK
jgi:hypothetical protein